jgi:tetratricopeptide (TPR) repeat protein
LTSAADFATTRSWMPHAWTRAALANLPPGALVLTQSDDLAAGIAAAQLLEGARPDVITFPAQHLHKSFGEASAERPEIQRLRAAAAVAGTEAERIAAVIAAHPGAVAVERPGTALFASSPWYARGGAIPLRIGGPGAPTDAPTPPAEIERWLPEVESREDRRRLATALADLARGQFRLRGDVARAVAILELSLSQVEADHASALVSLAALRMGTGQRQAAEALLRRAIELEPGRVVAWMNLAGLLMDDPGRGDEAEAAAQRAVDLSPQRADAWQRLAQVRARRGDEAGAGAAQTEADARREASTRSPVIGDP